MLFCNLSTRKTEGGSVRIPSVGNTISPRALHSKPTRLGSMVHVHDVAKPPRSAQLNPSTSCQRSRASVGSQYLMISTTAAAASIYAPPRPASPRTSSSSCTSPPRAPSSSSCLRLACQRRCRRCCWGPRRGGARSALASIQHYLSMSQSQSGAGHAALGFRPRSARCAPLTLTFDHPIAAEAVECRRPMRVRVRGCM